jgi:hypothetical protein
VDWADAQMKANSALMGMAGQPVQVRNHSGAGVQTETGPNLKSDLPVAGSGYWKPKIWGKR